MAPLFVGIFIKAPCVGLLVDGMEVVVLEFSPVALACPGPGEVLQGSRPGGLLITLLVGWRRPGVLMAWRECNLDQNFRAGSRRRWSEAAR